MRAPFETLGSYATFESRVLLAREVIETIAAETGGWFYDSRDLRQFQKLRDELSSQYLLEYRSTNPKMDGKYRKIRIESKNKDFKLKHRLGYYAGK